MTVAFNIPFPYNKNMPNIIEGAKHALLVQVNKQITFYDDWVIKSGAIWRSISTISYELALTSQYNSTNERID